MLSNMIAARRAVGRKASDIIIATFEAVALLAVALLFALFTVIPSAF
jgi:hypothetical protein